VKRALIVAAGALGLVVAAAALWPTTLTPEQRVERALGAIADAAEERDLAGVMDRVSPAYADADGLTREQIGGVLFRQFSRTDGGIHVVLSPAIITVDGEQAAAEFEAMLAEGSSFPLWPQSVDALHFRVKLERRDGDWMVTWHEREPVINR